MTTPYQDRPIRMAALNIGDNEYFAAADRGELLIRRCGDCGRLHHYPRAICPFCMSSATEWVRASGEGTLYTYSVTRRGVAGPYAIAYVTLDEGPTMLTNIVDCDLDTIRIGQRVKLTFKRAETGEAIPMFRPA